jgi:D-sedoheptulose 7-phosphate isomerase
VYLLGNGGSAATASHMTNELNKQCMVEGRPRFRAVCLADNAPTIMAWANDTDYANVFAEQLANHVEADDVVVAFSTSGNSPNVLRALELARAAGAHTIGLTGRHGGRLRELVDCCIAVPSDDIGHQEDAHLVVNHAIGKAIRAGLIESA